MNYIAQMSKFVICANFEAFPCNKLIQNMKTNDFFSDGGYAKCAYSSPRVVTFTLRSVGVLCSSYDDPSYGYDDENDLGEI